MILDIEHTGIAVSDIVTAEKDYKDLGYHKLHDGILDDLKRDVQVSFMQKGENKIELLAPLYPDKKSPVDKFNALNMGYVMYHLAYRVINLEEVIAYLQSKGYIQIEKISISQFMENRREVYMYHSHMGLVELLEDLPRGE